MTDSGAREDLPLAGVTVLDFSQFLAGPVAALRLADLGARVIKIERPGSGDSGRGLAFAGIEVGEDALSFHVMNRGKESFVADLKQRDDLEDVRLLLTKADVLVENFRPGVMQRIGLDYETVSRLNPRLVYASVTGYGRKGPFATMPGQDLLAQSVSGLPWLNGHHDDPPLPVGIAVADVIASCHLAEGILALLFRRERTGNGGLVETSLMEGLYDLQMELVAAYRQDPALRVTRAERFGAHAFLGAPYGIYPTADGYLALAMNPLSKLAEALDLPELLGSDEPERWLVARQGADDLIAQRLRGATTDHWLTRLRAVDAWCAPVHTLQEAMSSDAFRSLEMTQVVHQRLKDGESVPIEVTRSPLRIDGQPLTNAAGSPLLGEQTRTIRRELGRTGDKEP